MRIAVCIRFFTACCLLSLCSCSRKNGEGVADLKSELEAVRVDAATARTNAASARTDAAAARADAAAARTDAAAARAEGAKLKGVISRVLKNSERPVLGCPIRVQVGFRLAKTQREGCEGFKISALPSFSTPC